MTDQVEGLKAQLRTQIAQKELELRALKAGLEELELAESSASRLSAYYPGEAGADAERRIVEGDEGDEAPAEDAYKDGTWALGPRRSGY